MASFVHNPIRKHFFSALILFFCLSLCVFAQENQPTLEAALALTEPNARIEALQKYLQAKPDAANADEARAELTRSFAYLGETQLGQKNVDGAMIFFKQAITAFPKQVDDKFFTEVAVSIPLAVSVRGYRTEAILLARQLEARFAKEPKHLSAIGEFYLSLEAPGEALRALQSASKLAPDDARLYRALGAAYRLNLHLDDAAAQYQSAIKADPKDPRAYFELANLQRAQGRYEVAINLYNHQLSIEPQHAASMKGSALALLAQGKESQATELLNQAARITNTNLQQDNFLQTQLAFVYLTRGNTAKAREAANAALAIEPRYSWSQIAAAEVELAEGKYFEAERHVLTAMRYADFPTLHFMLGKVYLLVEDYEGALEQFGKAFALKNGKFQTRLGGVMETQADSLAQLLAPERKASLFQAEPITSEIEFGLIENLVRFEEALKRGKKPAAGTVSSLVLNQAATKLAAAEVEKTSADFAETEATRRAFRWLYAAERLLQTNQSAETALKFSDQALEIAEIATEPDGALRDLPNIDRTTRLAIFRARALTLRGRSLLRLGRKAEAVATLESALDTYGTADERHRAQWQLAVAKESLGQNEEALKLYIAAYEPPEKNSVGADLNRVIIEGLYRKTYGSLAGLDERIGKARATNLFAKAATKNPPPAPPINTPEIAKPSAPTPETSAPVNTATAQPAENSPAPTIEKAAPEKIVVTAPTLPEARVVTLALDPASFSLTEFAAPVIEIQDAPLPATPSKLVAEISAAMAKSVKPETVKEPEKAVAKETIAETPKETVMPPATIVAEAVTLPEARVVAGTLSTEFALLSTAPEFGDEIADVPPPVLAAAAAKAAPDVAATETAVLKPSESSPAPETKTEETIAPAITLPAPGTIPFIVLPVLEFNSPGATDVAALIPDEDVPAPSKATVIAEQSVPSEKTVVKTPTVVTKEIPAPPTEKIASTNKAKIGLSDAKVAEIEKAIEASTTESGGKKGNGAAADEEAAIGHIEGDLPVRIKAQPKIETPPAGVSGHAADGKALVPTDAPSSTVNSPLPPELEKRASDMGKTAGKLSAGAAMEIEAPDKPAGAGRKGQPVEAEPTVEENTNKPAARPRRVKENR